MSARQIALGAVVLVHPHKGVLRDGVVTEVIKARTTARRVIEPACHRTRRTRYVIDGESFRVIRTADQIDILVP